MIKNIFILCCLSFLAIADNAPDFTLPDVNGNSHQLSAYKGKWVVLEWTNYSCPFVRKHYESKNMQTLQKEYTDKGVIWFSICSSAKGKQGHFSSEEIIDKIESQGATPTAYLIDEKGTVGKQYQAKTTPHMFVIDPSGNLVYQGAIDDVNSFNANDVKEAKNFIRLVLDNCLSGKNSPIDKNKPYGCSVKY